MGDINPFSAVGAAVVELLTRHSAIFVGTGMNMFRAFAVIVVCWFGIKTALSSADGGSPIQLSNLLSLILLIGFGHTMITYYAAPIPGIGRSFTQLITDQAAWLAAQIETTQVQMLSDRLNEVFLGLEKPLLFDWLHMIGYLIVSLSVTFARIVLVGVIAFGWVATGVGVLVGPLFIPFLIVPTMEWMFWGWFRALLQYAFYQVFAQAFVFVFGNFLINILDAFPPPYTVDRLLVGGFHVMSLVLVFTYGLLKVPSMTNSFFSGRSGEAALPRFLN
jgi:hypothetical protein